MSGVERCFDALVRAAVAGDRCPPNLPPIRTAYIEQLALAGRIECLVYGDGWRVVEILTGPHAGARTKEAPPDSRPWRSYSASGCTVDRFRARERARKSPRPVPSLPIIILREVPR